MLKLDGLVNCNPKSVLRMPRHHVYQCWGAVWVRACVRVGVSKRRLWVTGSESRGSCSRANVRLCAPDQAREPTEGMERQPSHWASCWILLLMVTGAGQLSHTHTHTHTHTYTRHLPLAYIRCKKNHLSPLPYVTFWDETKEWEENIKWKNEKRERERERERGSEGGRGRESRAQIQLNKLD